ncbi:MAG: hypothetical protein WKF37_10060 [Bryobacteraceae bacterium]
MRARIAEKHARQLHLSWKILLDADQMYQVVRPKVNPKESEGTTPDRVVRVVVGEI